MRFFKSVKRKKAELNSNSYTAFVLLLGADLYVKASEATDWIGELRSITAR